MLTAKLLLTTQLRGNIGPTTCRVMVHTDKWPDHTSFKLRPQLATKYFNQFPDYCQMVNDAKSRAKRSILIDNYGAECIDLKTDYTNIEHVYSIERHTKRGINRLTLIEFESEKGAQEIVAKARHNEDRLPVPLKIFRYHGQSSSESDRDFPFPVDHVKLSNEHDSSLVKISTFSELMANNMMSLVALKLRFITLVNFEHVLCSGLFGEYELMPYGSSMMDTGCDSGDLDLCLTRKDDHHKAMLDAISSTSRIFQQRTSSSLSHLDKSLYQETKDFSGIRGTMRLFEHILREYMPLTDGHRVLAVPHAKVPIIKFKSLVTAVDCDLSFNLGMDSRDYDSLAKNYSGIIMSQILYSLCRNNNLFTAVVVYLRIFGKLTSITSKITGVGFTNFQFLSLIMFYLQQISLTSQSDSPKNLRTVFKGSKEQKPILPSFRELLDAKLSLKNPSIDLSEEQLNQILPRVLEGFFKFYSRFDFDVLTLNLYDSKVEKKMDNSTIFVLNPLDRTRNICHNIHRKTLELFVKNIRTSLDFLEKESALSLIKNLQLLHEKQRSKKLRIPIFDQNDFQSQTNVRTDGIAQDVCR